MAKVSLNTEDLDRQYERKRKGACPDWQEKTARREYYREKYRASRLALLDKLVPDRTCPTCKRVRTKSRSWVVVSPVLAICRSCYYAIKE